MRSRHKENHSDIAVGVKGLACCGLGCSGSGPWAHLIRGLPGTDRACSFEDWVRIFDADQPQLNADNIITLTRGVNQADASQVRIVCRAPSLEALQENMAGNSSKIDDSGHVVESTVFEVFSE